MKRSHSLFLLIFLLASLLIFTSCGEFNTPGDPISIRSNSPREAYLDEQYAHLIRVTGGLNSYSYKIEKGSLPPGLSLSTSGGIRGVPTTEGTYSFTVVVSDANLSTTFADMVMTVRKAPPAQLRLNIPLTEMRETFTVRPEIIEARALQGFRTKLNWDAERFNLVEGSLRSTSDRVIMFQQLRENENEGVLHIDIAVKGEALTGNHRLFLFELEPVEASTLAIQGSVEFVNQDGKSAFQNISEGQQAVTTPETTPEQQQNNPEANSSVQASEQSQDNTQNETSQGEASQGEGTQDGGN